MGFISVLNTTINIIYTFPRQANQEKKKKWGRGKFLTLKFKKEQHTRD